MKPKFGEHYKRGMVIEVFDTYCELVVVTALMEVSVCKVDFKDLGPQEFPDYNYTTKDALRDCAYSAQSFNDHMIQEIKSRQDVERQRDEQFKEKVATYALLVSARAALELAIEDKDAFHKSLVDACTERDKLRAEKTLREKIRRAKEASNLIIPWPTGAVP